MRLAFLGCKLKLCHQIANTQIKGFCYSQQSVKANPLFSPFNFSNIDRMQICLFSQFLLAQVGLLSVTSDRITQDFKLARARHDHVAKHVHGFARTPNMGLFCYCKFFGMR